MDLVSTAEELLLLINNPTPFPETQYPFPLNQALLGQWDLEALRQKAKEIDKLGLEDQLGVLLALAEAVEASQPDKDAFFFSDLQTRMRLNRLNNNTGWALIWGGDDERTIRLASLLQEEKFSLYSLRPEGSTSRVKQSNDLGSRLTSSVYFY